VNATLIQGACTDFGVISDPARVKVSLQWLNLGPEATGISVAPTTLLFAPWGSVRVDPFGVELDHRECLRLGNSPAATEAPGAKLGVRASFGTTPLVFVSIWPV
jgi:hypothetical protein